MGQHEIQLVNKYFSNVIVMSLMDAQRNMESNIISWDISAANLKETFSEDEWKYYNFLKTGKTMGTPERYLKEAVEDEGEETSLSETITVITLSVRLKYVLLGMVMFAFIYAGYVFLKSLFNDRLTATDSVKQLYSVPQLGMIPQSYTKKKPLDFIDHWIQKVCNRNKRTFTTEDAIGLAAIAIKIGTKKD